MLDSLTGERKQFSLQVTNAIPGPLVHQPAPKTGTRYPVPDQPGWHKMLIKARDSISFKLGIVGGYEFWGLVRQESRAVDEQHPCR